MNDAANPNRPAAINRNSHGASGELWAITTSSTIVFSMIGVSAATDWPRIDTPNAMNTLRLCAMRNGSIRRSQPPASGGAGSGVGRVAGSIRLPVRTMVLPDRFAQRVQPVDHGVAILRRRFEHPLELGRHRVLRLSQRRRAGRGHLQADAPPVALDMH